MKLKTLLKGFGFLLEEKSVEKPIFFWDGLKECSIKHVFELDDRIVLSTDNMIDDKMLKITSRKEGRFQIDDFEPEQEKPNEPKVG